MSVFLQNIGFDRAENKPSKVRCNGVFRFFEPDWIPYFRAQVSAVAPGDVLVDEAIAMMEEHAAQRMKSASRAAFNEISLEKRNFWQHFDKKLRLQTCAKECIV